MADTAVLDNIVERYIALRDKKAKIVADAKEKVATIDDVLLKAEAAMLAEFKRIGVESVRTPHGTAYKSTKTSATVTDWQATLDFIKQTDAWYMLEKRVSKDAVKSYREENDDIPPGINWREEISVNIRRT